MRLSPLRADLFRMNQEYSFAWSFARAVECLGHQGVLMSTVTVEPCCGIASDYPPMAALVGSAPLAASVRLSDRLELSPGARHPHGKKPTARRQGGGAAAWRDLVRSRRPFEPRGHRCLDEAA